MIRAAKERISIVALIFHCIFNAFVATIEKMLQAYDQWCLPRLDVIVSFSVATCVGIFRCTEADGLYDHFKYTPILHVYGLLSARQSGGCQCRLCNTSVDAC